MFRIEQTAAYKAWFAKVRDENAKARIDIRVRRLSKGNFGDAKYLDGGVSELRIDYGPGYRVYFMRKQNLVILLLAGGDKRTQPRDIAKAIALAESERRER